MKKVLLLPGWMTSLKLYNNDGGFRVCLGILDNESLSSDYAVGVSLGALVVLRDIKNIKGKIISPIPKRNIIRWFVQWLKYITSEGLFLERQKFTINPIKYTSEVINCIKLLNIDFSESLNNPSKDKVVVIKSKNDRFFCDDIAVEFLHSKGIKVIGVEGGHDWNRETEKMIRSLTL